MQLNIFDANTSIVACQGVYFRLRILRIVKRPRVSQVRERSRGPIEEICYEVK
jgi:hypothetical protein